MELKLDTGGLVTLVSEETYHNTWPQGAPALDPSSMELRTYTGEKLELCAFNEKVDVDLLGELLLLREHLKTVSPVTAQQKDRQGPRRVRRFIQSGWHSHESNPSLLPYWRRRKGAECPGWVHSLGCKSSGTTTRPKGSVRRVT